MNFEHLNSETLQITSTIYVYYTQNKQYKSFSADPNQIRFLPHIIN